MHWSSWECCWVFLVVMPAGHSVAGGVDCHSAAGTVDAAGLGCDEGADHDSTD